MTLILRTCKSSGLSSNGFIWNLEIDGTSTAPDWEPTNECGKGLHGFLNGEGNGNLADWGEFAVWVVAEPIGEIIDLQGKVKFRSAITKFVGAREDATEYLARKIGRGYAIVGGTSISGDGGTSISGDRGTSISGDGGTSISGDGGTIAIRWWDEESNRYRFEIGYIGENGLEPNIPYQLDAKHKFIQVESRCN